MFSGEDDYLAFGMSGASNKARMVGADVTIAYIDGARGAATDYNITAEAAVWKVIFQFSPSYGGHKQWNHLVMKGSLR